MAYLMNDSKPGTIRVEEHTKILLNILKLDVPPKKGQNKHSAEAVILYAIAHNKTLMKTLEKKNRPLYIALCRAYNVD